MLCPYCLIDSKTPLSLCDHCKQSLPPAYLQAQTAKSARPPVIISIVGFSGHGKTVYLTSLFHMLERLMPRYWPEFSPLALDQDTLTSMEERHQLLQKGKLPESTRLNFPKPSIHKLSGIPQYGDRILLLYDPPGEAFNRDEGIGQYAGFVKRSNCVLFLISLPNLDEPVADGMFKLLNTYILGMSSLEVPEKVQHLIVAYTKADEIIGRMASPELQQYLRQQGVEKLENLKEYYREMEGISKSLEKFTAETLDAQRFLNQARRYFKSVTFTAVSSLGSQPRNGELEEQIAPRRVLDPLLWVLSKSAVIFEEPAPQRSTQVADGEPTVSPPPAPRSAPVSQGSSGSLKRIVLWGVGILLCLVIVIGVALRPRVPQPEPFTGMARVKTQALALRRSPGSNKKDWILFLPQGAQLTLLGEAQSVDNGTWVRVRVENQTCKFGADSRDSTKWTEQFVSREEGWVNAGPDYLIR